MGDRFFLLMGQCVRVFFNTALEPYEEAQGGLLDGASQEQIAILRDIITFSITSDKYFQTLAKQYFAQYGCTQKEFIEANGGRIHTLNSQLRRGKLRIQHDFGESFLQELTGKLTIGGNKLDSVRVEHYRLLYNRVSGLENKLYSVLDLDLSTKRGELNATGIEDEQWTILYTLLNMYTPLQRRRVADGIQAEEVGYLNYLICSKGTVLSDADKKRQEQLFKLINDNQSYIEANKDCQ